MGVCLSKEATDAVVANNNDSKASAQYQTTRDSNGIKTVSNNGISNNPDTILSQKYESLLLSMNRIPIIATLNDKAKNELAQCLIEKIYESGEFLMKQGDYGSDFFLIINGQCDVFIGSKKIAQLNDNDYCGEQALLSANCQRTASVVAAKKTFVYVMQRDVFNKIIRNTNEMKNVYLRNNNNNQRNHNIMSDLNSNANSSQDSSNDDDDNNTDGSYNNNNNIVNENTIDPNMNENVLLWLTKCVQTNLLFSDLSNDDIYKICQNMKYKEIQNIDTIIEQSDSISTKDNKFYVINNGTFVIEKNGQIVDTITKESCVGELSLVFNAPRSATIRCHSNNGSVWYLTRKQYRYFNTKIRRNIDNEKTNFLRQVPLFQSLYNSEIALMARALTKEVISKNTVLFKQGDIGDKFYLIMNGTVTGKEYSINKIGHNKKSLSLTKTFELSKFEYFGELSLKYEKPRSATIIAKTDLILLSVESKDFNVLFGSLDSLMERQIEEYQRKTQSEKEYRINLFKRNLNDFIKGPFVGRGKYGCVQFVKDNSNNNNNNNNGNNNDSNTVYALKRIDKKWVHSSKMKQSKRRINALFNERDIMREFSNDYTNKRTSKFLVTLHSTFKDENNIYFLMSAATGGDFFNILKTRGYVSEKVAQFYIACIIEGIDCLHKYSMIHRDLKPENIVINKNGYAMITDFGFTKKLTHDNKFKTYTLCGTPGYMAPEVILGHGYSFGCDWFSIGCVLYDMVTGAPPFPTKTDQFTMIKTIMSNKLHLPMYLSFWIKDLIVQFLKIKPTKRLGIIKHGIHKIRSHHFFNDFDWNSLHNQTLKAPIKPILSHDMDPSNFDTTVVDDIDNQINDNDDSRVPPLHASLNNWDIAF